eukprot:6543169-Prymnesium_polylepis.1
MGKWLLSRTWEHCSVAFVAPDMGEGRAPFGCIRGSGYGLGTRTGRGAPFGCVRGSGYGSGAR